MNKRALVYGFLLGSAAGAISALLTAPSSGKDFRIQLKESQNEWANNLKEIKENLIKLKNSFAKLSSEGKAVALDLIHDIKTSINVWQKEIEPNKQSLLNEIKEIQKTIEELEIRTKKQS